MKILNRRTDEIPEGAVPVHRPSLLGNPFKLNKVHAPGDRKKVIAPSQVYFDNRVKSDRTFREQLAKIKDAPALVCWCAPEPCHAEVIREYLEEMCGG